MIKIVDEAELEREMPQGFKRRRAPLIRARSSGRLGQIDDAPILQLQPGVEGAYPHPVIATVGPGEHLLAMHATYPGQPQGFVYVVHFDKPKLLQTPDERGMSSNEWLETSIDAAIVNLGEQYGGRDCQAQLDFFSSKDPRTYGGNMVLRIGTFRESRGYSLPTEREGKWHAFHDLTGRDSANVYLVPPTGREPGKTLIFRHPDVGYDESMETDATARGYEPPLDLLQGLVADHKRRKRS